MAQIDAVTASVSNAPDGLRRWRAWWRWGVRWCWRTRRRRRASWCFGGCWRRRRLRSRALVSFWSWGDIRRGRREVFQREEQRIEYPPFCTGCHLSRDCSRWSEDHCLPNAIAPTSVCLRGNVSICRPGVLLPAFTHHLARGADLRLVSSLLHLTSRQPFAYRGPPCCFDGLDYSRHQCAGRATELERCGEVPLAL